MPNQPHPQPRPAAPPAPTKPPEPMKPPEDPQAAKLDEAHASERNARPEWRPEPALDPRAETPPEGVYADGMSIADEQRARAAWVEAHGLAEYHAAVDQRPPEERANQQVPGVAPPAKRS